MNVLKTHIAGWIVMMTFMTALTAQSPLSTITIRLVNRDGDTVVYNRIPSNWRVGVELSGTLQKHFGSLVVPISNMYPCNGDYAISGPYNTGLGVSGGLAFDYQRPDDDWGFSLIANPYDFRSVEVYARSQDAPINENFLLDNTFTSSIKTSYVSIIPMARYNIENKAGFHLLMGLDFDIKLESSMQRTTTQYALERVDVIQKFPFDADKFRYGLTAGLGYDLLAGVNNNWRMTLTPFALLHVGSPIFSQSNSNWNSITARLGVSLKFGQDEINEQVLPRDPNYSEPAPSTIAQTDEKINVAMPESKGMFIAMLVPTVAADIVPPVEIEKPVPSKPVTTDKIAYAGKIIPNGPEVFSTYNSSLDTAISPTLRGYLDAVADYLLKHPNSEARIIGHSDNFGGTPTETQRVSDERALQVVRYLIKRGISRDRLLASGLGARNPIQNNRTAQGRNANRRVEITIVQ